MKDKQLHMKNLIKLEEIGQFLLAIMLFSNLNYSWWMFPACLLLPDVSMIGYAINPKIGAYVYNIFHHKFIAIIVLIAGYLLAHKVLIFTGIILFAHAAMDRIFGYGLKYTNDFKNTHLGFISKKQIN